MASLLTALSRPWKCQKGTPIPGRKEIGLRIDKGEVRDGKRLLNLQVNKNAKDPALRGIPTHGTIATVGILEIDSRTSEGLVGLMERMRDNVKRPKDASSDSGGETSDGGKKEGSSAERRRERPADRRSQGGG